MPHALQSKPLRIGVIANPQHAHGRNFLRGTMRYIEERRPEIEFDTFTQDCPKSVELLMQYDGFITADVHDELRKLPASIPVVRVGHELKKDSPHEYAIDDYEVGALAARTLNQCGVIAYGYYVGPHIHNETIREISSLRSKGFREEIQKRSSPLFEATLSTSDAPNDDALYKWLLKLPKPAGIFTFNDLGALTLAEVCRQHRINIPDEVSIIGVDNDRLLCSLNQPKISSIDPGVNELSFDAMHHLIQRIESGNALPAVDTHTAPIPVAVLRETTGHCSCPHSIIQQALSEIDRQSPHNRSPSEIAAAIGISLRSLEGLVKEQLGSTLQNMLLEAQMKDVKQLLRTTDSTIEKICAHIDWDPSSLQRAFKRSIGHTVGAYRAQFRPNPPLWTAPKHFEKDQHLTIGIISALTSQSHHDLLRGMEDYCQTHPGIHLALRITATLAGSEDATVDLGKRQSFTQYDGFAVTAEVDCPEEILNNKPIITIDHQRNQKLGGPFHVDNYGAGKLASQHFLQKGYTQFAYISYVAETAVVGNRAIDTRSSGRYQGFFDGLINTGISKENIRQSQYTSREALSEWVATLPAKTAIYVFNDALATHTLQACQQTNRAVPDDISILSTDNDLFQCNLSKPSLSSIDIEFRKAGNNMMEALVECIQNPDTAKIIDNQIRARHVIERESTRELGTHDADLEAAIRYIHAHYTEDINIDDIVEATTLKRRSLETRFKHILSRSILKELQSTRLQAAADLLTGTSLSVKEISAKCGFKNSQNFCKAFKSHTGKTPLGYQNPDSRALSESTISR